MKPRLIQGFVLSLLLYTTLSARTPNAYSIPPSYRRLPPALAQFGMVLKATESSLFAHGPVIISQGVISRPWNVSCFELQGSDCSPLFTIDAYGDALTFEYMFSDASLYDFGRPILTARGGRAQPVIEDFSTDVEQRSGEIRIWHNCARISADAIKSREKAMRGDRVRLQEMDISIVTLSLRLSSDITVSIGWRKTCGYGVHRHLDYGIEVGESARSLRVADKGVKVGPETVSTRMFLRATDGVQAPHFLSPYVVATKEMGPVVVPLVRGWESDDNGAGFYVLYGCERLGVARISATVALPPFENVTMIWEKDCGGGKEETLNVVAVVGGKEQSSKVVAHGQTTSVFAKGAEESLENEVPHNQESVTFLVAARAGTKIGPPSASSNDGRVVRAEVMGALREGGMLGEIGKWIEVRVKCRKVGVALVTVTVPILDRVPGEWIFYKRCFGPQDAKRNIRPLGLFVGMLVVLWVVYVLQKVANAVPVRKGVRFAKISRTE